MVFTIRHRAYLGTGYVFGGVDHASKERSATDLQSVESITVLTCASLPLLPLRLVCPRARAEALSPRIAIVLVNFILTSKL